MNDEVAHVLAPLSKAQALLTSANTVDAVKGVRDKAQALTLYAKQAQYGIEIQNECAELKIRAERKAGELLSATLDRGRPPEKRLHDETFSGLPDGISKTQSHRWQAEASVPDETFEAHVAKVKAKKEELTSAGVRRLVRKAQHKETAESPPLPEGAYDVIYADPPWGYAVGSTTLSRVAENHYPTMALDDIKALEVPSADDAVLFLWVPVLQAEKGFEVVNAWGFVYQSQLAWDQQRLGEGKWMRIQHEMLYFATKGKIDPPDPDHRMVSILREHRGTGSNKPDMVYDQIKRMFPGRRYLDLFPRGDVPDGWTAWGLEAESAVVGTGCEHQPNSAPHPAEPATTQQR